MAKQTTGAYIGFDNDNRLGVVETPEQIREAISDLDPAAAVPLLALTRRSGDQVLVNAKMITTISLPKGSGSASFP
jgi:hypothetical protein